MHLDEEQLQRLMHGELATGALAGARDHLAECSECRSRLNRAQRDEGEIFALLRRLDHPVPAVDAETLAGRARRAGWVWGRWAAGILLFVGMAGAAYAIPGSPLRDWVRTAVVWVAGSDHPPSPPGQVKVPSSPVAGIAAMPGKEFAITFESPEPGGLAQVSLTDGDEVTVRAPASAASFTSSADRLVITNRGRGATFQIEIPRSAPRVEIRVAGDRIFLKDGRRVSAAGASPAAGRFLIPLLSPQP